MIKYGFSGYGQYSQLSGEQALKAHLYLEYFNNYLTIGCFAEHNDLSEHAAKVLISKGRLLHNDQFGHH